jgi:uncharacterized membrane-anchored protein YjiN (DUF445 family)
MIMTVGSLTMFILLSIPIISHPIWHIIDSAFLAGLVGSLADWYAVHVLLYPAPVFMRFWPFKKHSNLLIRNRPKLEENIVGMVQDELLSPDKIWDHVEQINVFGHLLTHIQRRETISKVVEFVQTNELLVPIANQLDREDLAQFLDDSLKKQLGKFEFAQPLGKWMIRAINRGDHYQIWETLLNGLDENLRSKESIEVISKVIKKGLLSYLPTLRTQANSSQNIEWIDSWLRNQLENVDIAKLAGSAVKDAIQKGSHNLLVNDLLQHLHGWVHHDPQLRSTIRIKLDDVIENYKQGSGPFRKFFVKVFETLAVDKDRVTESITAEIAKYIYTLKNDASHEMRLRLNAEIEAYAEKMITGDEEVLNGIEKLRKELLSVNLDSAIRQLLNWGVDTLEKEFQKDPSDLSLLDFTPIANSLVVGASTLIDELKNNPNHFIREKVDTAVRQYAEKLSMGEPDAVGFMERLKNDILSHTDLTKMIKETLQGFKSHLLAQLAQRDGFLWGAMGKYLADIRDHFISKPQDQERILVWTRQKAKAILEENHYQIGTMVKTSLSLFSDESLIEIVDDKFGEDLQFVRLNGAVLGFLIGAVLAGIPQILRSFNQLLR